MKIVIGILIVIVATLGWQLIEKDTTNTQLRGQLDDLTSKLNDKVTRENFEIQEKCAAHADKLFTQLGYSLSKDNAVNQSHFNAKFNKCFMNVSLSHSGGGVWRFLIDVFEQKKYANFMRTDKKQISCRLTPPGEDERICNSENEFDAFIAGYLK